MIDLHAHVLPGIDDGPRSTEEALAVVEAARLAGTTTIVATPHVSVRYRLTSRQIRGAVEAMNAALAHAQSPVQILPGAEIALERLIDLDTGELDRLGLGGGRCLLIEPPLRRLAGDVEWPIRSLLEDPTRRVLLAHAERCPIFMRQPRRLHELVEAGALVQVTAGSLMGRFGRATREFALLLVRCGYVHNVASDMHDVAARSASLQDALAVLEQHADVSRAQAAWLTEDVPQALVEGRPLPVAP